jgi:lipopolysaccharide/colanic/teichoic acid biosynthesis glycosyltransferase
MGDMALVGPRPERPEFTNHLGEVIPGYLERLKVLPGITGLAQVNLPPDCDIESVRRKLVLDLEYIRSGSLGLDLLLIVCTALKLACIPSYFLLRVTGIQRNPSPAELALFDTSISLSAD